MWLLDPYKLFLDTNYMCEKQDGCILTSYEAMPSFQ